MQGGGERKLGEGMGWLDLESQHQLGWLLCRLEACKWHTWRGFSAPQAHGHWPPGLSLSVYQTTVWCGGKGGCPGAYR